MLFYERNRTLINNYKLPRSKIREPLNSVLPAATETSEHKTKERYVASLRKSAENQGVRK